jgi:hypothetical protein
LDYKDMQNKIKRDKFYRTRFLTLLTQFFSYRHIQILEPNKVVAPQSQRHFAPFNSCNSTFFSKLWLNRRGIVGRLESSWYFMDRFYSAATKPFNDAIANTLKNGGIPDYHKVWVVWTTTTITGVIPADSYQATWNRV